MIVKYLVSAPGGDIPVGPDELARPFKITPTEEHPSMTLGDYFKAIENFVLKDQSQPLIALLKDRSDKGISLDRIKEILIRTEKHGAFYHLASFEILFDRDSVKLALSTALSEEGKALLGHEFETMNSLAQSPGLPYLPKVYFKGEFGQEEGAIRESLFMSCTEWFEGYHEWHLSIDEEENEQKFCIWDLGTGYRFASRAEGLVIFRQASKILTLYYDPRSFRQIYPWHHAAGDFVVRDSGGDINVKLTTARRYEPVMMFLRKETINPTIALLYFFLNLTVKMRLDKLDGMGKTAWAGDYSVWGAVHGFFEALRAMEGEGRHHLGKVEDLLLLLKGFDQEEIKKLLVSMLDFYRQGDPGDYSMIMRNLEGHGRLLRDIIQGFHL